MSKTKVLLVEDDINLGTILKEYLAVKGFEVELCYNGEDGIAIFNKYKYDICILDVMLPKLDGFSLARQIKKLDNHIPIVFLTAKALAHDKIEGFKIGADDYITKPFNAEELLFRINAILKRVKPSSGNGDTPVTLFTLGKYVFDYNHRTLSGGSKEQKLTTKEAELLKLLCININSELERTFALKTIWNDDNYFTARSMDVYITKLRSYFKEDESIQIVNLHGSGFKLIC
jgi:DNA-binding response OmpR family regulator